MTVLFSFIFDVGQKGLDHPTPQPEMVLVLFLFHFVSGTFIPGADHPPPWPGTILFQCVSKRPNLHNDGWPTTPLAPPNESFAKRCVWIFLSGLPGLGVSNGAGFFLRNFGLTLCSGRILV